jgi:hypothetical protein
MTDWHFFELLLLLSLFSQEAPSKKINFFSVLFRKFLPVIVDNIERITVLTVFLHYHWLFGSGILRLGLDLLLNKIRLRHWYYYYCDFNYLRLKIKNSIGHSPFFLFSNSIPLSRKILWFLWNFDAKYFSLMHIKFMNHIFICKCLKIIWGRKISRIFRHNPLRYKVFIF